MNKIALFLTSLILFTLLTSLKSYGIETVNFRDYFKDYNGTFVLYDITEDTYVIYNKTQAEKRLSPCSTFKIFNSLAGLESGVIKDENYVIKWDKTKYEIDSWNMDHTLRTAIKNSVVWYYQELARRVGKEKMKEYLDKTDYGNNDISGGIDRFWLMSSIKISAMEQVLFLKKFIDYNLPFSKRSIDIVKDIMILDKTDSYTLRGKTGSGMKDGKGTLGWFVGYVQKKDKTYIFTANIEGQDKAKGAEAKRISLEILKASGIIK